MASNGQLTAQPLSSTRELNWVLLIELLVCGILAVFFFGYFDRLFATLVSYGIRAYTWRNFHAYIDIQALQISLLGGRIFFKELRYHAHNETIIVHSGYITWKYWYRKVKDAEIFSTPAPVAKSSEGSEETSRSRTPSPNRQESGGIRRQKSNLPCRIQIKVEGVQAFLYNRSPVYDAIIDHFQQATTSSRQASVDGADKCENTTGSDTLSVDHGLFARLENRIKVSSGLSKSDSGGYSGDNREKFMARTDVAPKSSKLPSFLQLFPIRVRCKTAAAVLGNDNTKAVITAKLDTADGTFDAGHAGPLDIYKLLFKFEFQNTVIKMKPNHDYKEPQLAMAAGLKNSFEETSERKRTWLFRLPKMSGSKFDSFRGYFQSTASSESVRAAEPFRNRQASRHVTVSDVLPGQERWQGLTRYLDDDVANEHDEWDPIEYGLYSTLAEIPKIGMTFYWDIPGFVPSELEASGEIDKDYIDDINGSSPPEYGMDLSVYGGLVHYGPWADRHRIQFQNIFFPPTFTDAIPGKRLVPGQPRVSTVFKLFLSIEEDTTLRIPIREPSKDWKWKGKAASFASKPDSEARPLKDRPKGKRVPFWRSKDKGAAGPNMRPFAWLDLTVKSNSTVNYTADMIARPTGYNAKVQLDISALEIQTSVNHGLLWRSGCTRLDADTSVPLGWNSLRQWQFNVTNDDLELFILRDHLFLMVDLIGDWTSGPLQEFFTYVPYRYMLNVLFRNFKMYLNTNTSNIIDDPTDFDKNQFIILSGRELSADIDIPLTKFRPLRNEVFFDVLAKDLKLQLQLSPGNTVAAFLGARNVAELDQVTLKGSHAACTETSPTLTDRLTFNINGDGLDVFMFGYVVDRLITLKENYFGDDLHFRTLEEFQETTRNKHLVMENDLKAQQSNRGNDLDVILIISASRLRGYLPSNLYSADRSIAVDCPYATADLRLNNYYMDLQVDFSPLSVSHAALEHSIASPIRSASETQVFIASASLVGHRAFGLPPKEPDYLCLWDVDVGQVTGECTETFISQLVKSLACLGATLNDDENATALIEPTVVHDIQFLKLRTREVKLWLRVGSDALLMSTGPAVVDLADWASLPFSQRISIMVPDLSVAIVDVRNIARHRRHSHQSAESPTLAYLKTDLCLNVLTRKRHYSAERQKQQDHLIESDSRTHRTTFLRRAMERSASVHALFKDYPELPAMIYPPIPEPLQSGTETQCSTSLPPSLRRIISNDSSLASSRYFQQPRSRLSRQSSQTSLAASVRKTSRPDLRRRFFSAVQYPEAHVEPILEWDRQPVLSVETRKQSTASAQLPLSTSFSSPLATPYFPLQFVEPSGADLPPVKAFGPQHRDQTLPEFNDILDRDVDEEVSHTSLIISLKSGLRAVVRPDAALTIANMIDLVLPKDSADLLDTLHIQILSGLLGLEKAKEGHGATLEVALHLPYTGVRMLNNFTSSEIGPDQGVDQYDLEIMNLALSLSQGTQPKARSEHTKDCTLVHCTASTIQLAINEKAIDDSQQLGFRIRIDDLLLWLSMASKNSVHVSFRSLDIDAASKQIELLAAVVHRTFVLVNESVGKFSEVLQAFNERQRYLAYCLTMQGGDVADPPFLNRTGIAVRTTPHHVRNHDSWKIISRLRNVWQQLPDESKQTLDDECRRGGALYPSNAQAVVTKNWDEWRTWELSHVRNSYIMKILYGPTPDFDSSFLAEESVATELQIRSGALRVTIDPGIHQTQVAIHTLVLNLDHSPPLLPSGLMLVPSEDDLKIEDIVLQASARSITGRIDWHIINLVEHAIVFAERDLTHLMPARVKAPAADTLSSLDGIWRSFQVVVSVEDLGLALSSPNAYVLAASKAFRMSLVGTDKSASDQGQNVSALLHASESYIDIHSHQRHVLHLASQAPNLLIVRDAEGISSGVPEDVRVAGSTSNVIVETREEILGIIEVIDMIIREEVREGIAKFSPLVPKPGERSRSASKTTPIALPKITVALIMDTYRFNVALLPNIKFSMDGKLGRISISPHFENKLSVLDINLDLGEREHDLTSRDSTGTHVLSRLHTPPINGQIKVRRMEDRIDVEVTMIIETITLEAHAIHGLLSVLSQDEVSDTLQAIVADVKTLQHDINTVIPRPASSGFTTPKPRSGERLTYNAAVTLAGVQIQADAPGKLRDSGTAKLLMGFRCLNLRVANITPEAEILPLPEINAQMKEFMIELRIDDYRGTRRSGNLSLTAAIQCSLRKSKKRQIKRSYRAEVTALTVNMYAETASAVVDVLNHLQDRLKDVDLSKEKKYLRRLRSTRRRPSLIMKESTYSETSMSASNLLVSYISVSLHDIEIAWIVGSSVAPFPKYQPEDLVLSISLIDLSTKSEHASTLKIQNLQIQMVPPGDNRLERSINSALMPQLVFNVGYATVDDERRLAFQAIGESLDVVLDSKFMLPANMLQRSIELAIDKFKDVSSSWQMTPTATGAQRKNLFGDKRLSYLKVDADFAGAVLRLQGKGRGQRTSLIATKLTADDEKHGGRYGQFLGGDNAAGASIQTPGLAVKVQYQDDGSDSSLVAEVKINGSSNTLVPTVVPLILEISDSIKTIVAANEASKVSQQPVTASSSILLDENLLKTDPNELLGGTSINLGIRICRQEFSLSCSPIARVAASAHFDDIYITANNVKSSENDHFIAVSAQFENLQSSIQHIYSRESTFNFAIESITLSVMNSKHLSGKAGLCAVLKINPMRTHINARQLQDFLLFREIWLPPEIRTAAVSSPPSVTSPSDSNDYFVARYQQVTNTAAFPWTAAVQVAELRVDVDMGQSIGKATLHIDNLWASSRKDSNWEQNLIVGIGNIGIECTGRTSGFIDLSDLKVRTMIAWPERDQGHRQTPSIQASAGFERLRVKAAFDYQAFGIADIQAFDFLMYNVRPEDPLEKDRLVAMLEGGQVHVFCTATTAAQAVALFQAVEKLKQDTEIAYANSLKDIERFRRRQSTIVPTRFGPAVSPQSPLKNIKEEEPLDAPIRLYTDVVVTLRSIQIGAFPSAFFDTQIFLLEASDVQARFAAQLDHGKTRTGLGMTLGQLQVALAGVQHPTGPRTLQEITVDDVVATAVQSRGGTILRVPKVIATMETWQTPGQMTIEYIFKSRFEGKVDVGWNVGRISFIREMYNTHARNLASRLGKPLPESAVKIRTASSVDKAKSKNTETVANEEKDKDANKDPEKITAVVNVPQSKYSYVPLEPPIIETPQLRDMGEATPPLEWIGLQRDRLPNVTHQIIIVGLMGVAREVEDAYGRILGTS